MITQEQRLEYILQGTNAGTWEWNVQTGETIFNERWAEIIGYTLDEISPVTVNTWIEFCHPEDLQVSDQLLKKCFNGETEYYECEARMRHKNGQWVWVLDRGKVASWAEDGKPLWMFGTHQDITERKQEAEKLLESEALLKESQMIAGLGSYILDISTGLWSSSDVLDNIFGINKEFDRTVQGWARLIHPADRTMMKDYLGNEVLGKGKPFDKEYRIIRYNDKTERWVHGRGKLERNAHDELLKMHGTIQDITDRKKLEDQLLQAQKMEAIGTLAGGIAHDFNNILTAMLGYAELAELEIPAGNPLKNNIEQIIKAGNRAAELVRQILTFSRKGPETLNPLEPSVIIKEGLKLIRASLPTTIDIHEDIDPKCGTIVANPTNIHQVFLNLCTNALHAMAGEKGVLTVKLKRVAISEHESVLHSGVTAGPFVELLVNDTGCGMNSGIMKRIFDPYFTTKGMEKGSGLGLALVHGIVQGGGGFIKVKSELGKGSTFQVYFPVIEAESAITKEDKKPKSLPKGDERILVVDDEQAIVGMYKASLEKQGYTVTAYCSSKKMLEEFRRSPNSFDLILTDQTMPDLPGSELAKQVLQIRPDIPIILCTGYSSMISEETAEEIGIAKFLMKPVNRDDLAVYVREVLDMHRNKNF